jgi:hypothetical protein
LSDWRQAATILAVIVFFVVIVSQGVYWHTWQLMANFPSGWQ